MDYVGLPITSIELTNEVGSEIRNEVNAAIIYR